MPKLKVLSGSEVVNIFISLGFVVASRKGSHLKLVRVTTGGCRQILTVPDHRELDKGTLRAIFRQATRYVTEDELESYFYNV
jgi:predicted RNA binding protein YcfA (HicA-like mRNA interferase family)